MARIAKKCLQTSLKIVNLIIAIVGVAMILYSLWMVRVWQRDIIDGSSSYNVVPWFIYSFFGVGISCCLIACLGHIAADRANRICLSCYTVIIVLLLLLETTIIADIFLNADWEKDLPKDPTGRFEDFEDFVNSNFEICQWIGLLIVLAQGFLILLAMVLKTLEPSKGSFYDSDDDDDYAQARLPFLNHPVQQPQPYMVADPPFASKNDVWKLRIHEKINQ